MTSSEITYADSMDVFWGRYGKHNVESNFSLLGDKGNLTSVRSMLSVGPGDGWIDKLLISNCFPPAADSGLKNYVGVDPDGDMCQALSERMKTCFPEVKTAIHNCKIQDWEPAVNDEGVSEKFDLIFFYEMLYYFDETELGNLLRRCTDQLLAPGGRILISIDQSPSSFYISVVRKAWPEECIFVPDSNIIERLVREHCNGNVIFERWYEHKHTIDVSEPYEDAYLKTFTHQVTVKPATQSTASERLEQVRNAIRQVVNGKTEFEEIGSFLLISIN